MKTVCKKLLSIMLVAILLVSAVPFQAFADGEGQGPIEHETKFNLTLNADGGTVNGMTSAVKEVTYMDSVGELPTPVREGYDFVGWYTEGGDKVESSAVYRNTGDLTLIARWELRTNRLELKYVINSNVNDAHNIGYYDIAEGNKVLTWLNANAVAAVQAAVPAGYSWDTYWRDDRLNQLTQQNDTTDIPQVIYVDFVANEYTLNFHANGGTVSPANKKVTFGKAVGELPTPTKEGYIFMGWNTEADGSGTTYTKDTVYSVAGNTTIYAVWAKEASVILKIYINGDTANCDRMVEMTPYVKNNAITKSDVETVVKKYYAAVNSNGLSLYGLFNSTTWAAYKANTISAGANTVTVDSDEATTYVYVMVKNAKYGTTTGTTTGGTTSGGSNSGSNNETADPTNPKTGDMIGVSLALMMSTGGAALLLGKKRKF